MSGIPYVVKLWYAIHTLRENGEINGLIRLYARTEYGIRITIGF